MSEKSVKLEDEPLWQQANQIAEQIYAVLGDFPAEEKWNTEHKLRAAANNLLFTIAEALGNNTPVGGEYEWGQARKYLYGLKTMYRFAGRQGFIKIDPDVMLTIDAAIKAIDTNFASRAKASKTLQQKELDDWQAKYRLWAKMNNQEGSMS